MKQYLTYSFIFLILLSTACKSDPVKEKDQNVNSSETAETEEKEQIHSRPELEDSSLLRVNEQIRANINDPNLYVDRAKIYLRLGDTEAAVKDLDRAYKMDTTNLKTLRAQADFFAKRGKLDAAMRILQKAKKFHPESSELYTHIAELFLIGKANKQSLENADLAVKYDMYNEQAYYIKAFNFLEIGDTTKAISSFRTSVEQNPDFYEGYLQLGLLFADLGDPLAIDYFNNALEVKPNDRDALYSKGMFEQEHEMYNEAMKTYTQAIKAHPDFREAYYNMGFVHMYYLKLYSEALQYFDKAVKADPQYYQAYYNRGYSFELMGDINNAAKDYRNALKIKPDYTLAAQGLERVSQDLPKGE